MKITRGILILILLLVGTTTHAQCGGSNPCQPIPWDLPTFPELVSPTPITNGVANPPDPTNTPTITPTRTPFITSTPIPTFTPFMDVEDIEENIATVQAMIEGTPIQIINASGTPEQAETAVAGIANNAATFVGYYRTIEDARIFGPFTPLASLLFTGTAIVLLFKATTFILPIAAAIFGFIRKVVNIILDFIPL